MAFYSYPSDKVLNFDDLKQIIYSKGNEGTGKIVQKPIGDNLEVTPPGFSPQAGDVDSARMEMLFNKRLVKKHGWLYMIVH
jgi:hypothetical protein